MRIDAGRGREQVALHVVLLAGFEHVRVDQDVVLRDVGEERGDVADAAHVGGEVVDLIDVASGGQAVFPHPQVQNLKIVGSGLLILRLLDIDPTHPMTIGLQLLDQMMTNEPTGASYQNPSFVSHFLNSP